MQKNKPPSGSFTEKKKQPLTAFFSRAVKGYFSALLLSNILGYLSFCKVGGTG